jgi:hypothetical protein
MLALNLVRDPSANGCTIGRLSIDGEHQCYTCEDVVRPAGQKVPGQTAIPAGRYQVIVNRSERFSKLAGHEVLLPLLLKVPGFEGVRIHTGNVATDTEGCILPGLGRKPDGVTQSRAAFEALFARIQTSLAVDEEVWIEVTQA